MSRGLTSSFHVGQLAISETELFESFLRLPMYTKKKPDWYTMTYFCRRHLDPCHHRQKHQHPRHLICFWAPKSFCSPF